MARDKTVDNEISAMRADIADLVKSIGRLSSEVSEAAGTQRWHSGNGHASHHLREDFMTGAAKMGGDAAGAAGEAVHIGASWIDTMLRKNPTPAVIAALGIGFVFGVLGRR